MNPKYRALIWEQSRLAGVVALWWFGVCLCLEGFMWLLVYGNKLSPAAAREIAALPALFGSAATGLLLLFRFDVVGNLVMGTDPRLYRLPIETFPLMVTTLICRALGLTFVTVGLIAGYNLLLDGELPLIHTLWIVELYLVVQALSWSNKSIPWARYGLFFLAVAGIAIAVSILRAVESSREVLAGFAEAIGRILMFPPLAVAVTAGALTLTVFGVHWDRHAERRGPRTPGELWEHLAERRKGRTKPFRSALDAQIWYERQRFGKILPGVSALILFVLAVAVIAVFLTPGQETGPAQAFRHTWLLPPVALMLGSIIAGAKAGGSVFQHRFSKPPYPMLRPITSAGLGQAKLSASFDSLCLTLAAVLVISAAAFLAFNEILTELVKEALAKDELTLGELIPMIGRPLILVLVAAWALMWVSSRVHVVFLLGLVGIAGLFLLSELGALPGVKEDDLDRLLSLFGILFPILSLASLGRYAIHNRVLSGKVVAGIGLLWVVLSVAFMTADPGFAYSSWFLCISLALVAWALMPFLLAPLTIHHQRHH